MSLNKYNAFEMGLNLLIDANQSARNKKNMILLGGAQANREMKTVQISAGRNIGKTTCIASMMDLDRDVALFPTQSQKKYFLEQLCEKRFRNAYCVHWYVRNYKDIIRPKNIWVDNFSSLRGRDLSDIMKFFDSVNLDDDGTIILIG